MTRIFSRIFTPPLSLLWACLLCYGLAIPWLGLYADDWPFVYVHSLGGLRGVVEFISWVRPVAAWIFASETALVGTHFWAYHAILLLLRWVDALLLWQVLRLAWPNPRRGDPALWVALLFCVYPAFKQAPLALEYGPHFISLALLILSLGASLLLISRPNLSRRARFLLWAAAWGCSFQVFIIEYFVGLEILRPLLVWVVLRRSLIGRKGAGRMAARRALAHWLPFLPVLGGFLAWRVFDLGFPSYQPELLDGLAAAPLAAAFGLIKTIARDLWTAGIAAWVQPFSLIPAGKTGLAWAALFAAAFASLGGTLYLRQRQQHMRSLEIPTPLNQDWPLEALGIGALAMLAAGWPFWITRIPLQLNFPWDRPSLAFMLGACFLAAGLVGLLASLPRPRLTQPLVLAVVLAAAVGLHFQNAAQYRKEWSLLTHFYWQLAWRAPGLQPGTAVILDQTSFNYHTDKFLVPLLNWTYAPGSTTLSLPYWLFDFYKLQEKQSLTAGKSAVLETQYGTLSFAGKAEDSVFVIYSPPSCLYLLAAETPTPLPISDALRDVLALGNPSRVLPNPAQEARPPRFAGPEPAHDWCYYYEKAALALQSGGSAPGEAKASVETGSPAAADAAAQLGDAAFAAGLSPANPAEYLLFVDAYAQSGRWEDAVRLTTLAAKTEFTRRAACSTWERIAASHALEAAPMLNLLACAP